MQKVSDKKLVNQAEIWRKDAVMAPASYRLFVYTKLELLPEDIIESLEEEVKNTWDEQISFEGIESDLELTIRTIIHSVADKQVLAGFLFVPLLLADLFVLGKATGRIEGTYKQMINKYAEMVQYDRPVAEIDAIFGLTELIIEVAKKAALELPFDVSEVMTDIILQQDLINKQHVGKVVPSETAQVPTDFNSIIDKALQDYEDKTGVSVLEDIEDGADIEELEAELEKLKANIRKDVS